MTAPAARSTTLSCPGFSPATRTDFAAFYKQHGFAVARNVVSGATLAALQAEFNRTVHHITTGPIDAGARWSGAATDRLDPDQSTTIYCTHQIQNYSATWGQFCYHPGFLDIIEALIGPDIILHHSKLFEKPAGKGAPFPPHQDWSYFPSTGTGMLAAVIYLSPSDDRNGCLHVWPGSHHHGRIDPAASMRGDHGFDQRFPFSDSLACHAQPGDVVIFSDMTVHGSLPNRGDHPRKSILFQFHSGADRVEADGQHANANLPVRGWNHHMDRSRVR